jgi:two-component system, sensor histidine kinase and response regulator
VHALRAAQAQAERERDAYAAMLRSIIQNSPTAISVQDLQGRYLLVNEPFERLFGTRDADLLGLPNDAATGEPAAGSGAEDIRAQVGAYQMEECIDAADGPHMYESVRFPMYDAEGTLYATGGISLDVTEERRASARVAAALDTALAASRAKSTFLATMSHELRTPMNAVLGMADLLRSTNLDREQAECVETVSSSGNALLGVIDHVLDFSVIEAGEVELEPRSSTCAPRSKAASIPSRSPQRPRGSSWCASRTASASRRWSATSVGCVRYWPTCWPTP